MDVPFKTIFRNVGVSWSPYMQTRAALSWHNFKAANGGVSLNSQMDWE